LVSLGVELSQQCDSARSAEDARRDEAAERHQDEVVFMRKHNSSLVGGASALVTFICVLFCVAP
jgi:hypothetical protein